MQRVLNIKKKKRIFDITIFRKKIYFKAFTKPNQKKKINIVWDSGNGSAGKVMKESS